MDDLSPEEREALLQQGYGALADRCWARADAVFDRLLAGDPHCGMSCLGKAMAGAQIRSRSALAKSWDRLSEDPDFLSCLQPAKSDFLPWLRQDMAAAQAEMHRTLSLPDLSAGRGRLLIFSGVQVILYLAVALMLTLAEGSFGENLLGSALLCGIPVILGPVCGNSLIKAGRFRRVLKFFNNLSGIFGGGTYAILTAAAYLSARSEKAVPEDRLYCGIYFTVFVIHFLSLLCPVFLGGPENGD